MRVLLLAFLSCGAHALIAPMTHTWAVTHTPARSAPVMAPVTAETRKPPRVPGSRVVRFTGKATGQAVRATGKVAARIVRPVLRPFARPERMAVVEMQANGQAEEEETEEGMTCTQAGSLVIQTRADYGEVSLSRRPHVERAHPCFLLQDLSEVSHALLVHTCAVLR